MGFFSSSAGGGADITHGDVALQMATFGMSTGQVAANREARRAKRRASKEQAALDSRLARLDEVYGIGDSPTALQNRSRIEQDLSGFEGARLAESQSQIGQGYRDAERQSRFATARQGMGGSGLEQTRNRTLHTQRAQQEALAGEEAFGARTALTESLRTRRLAAEAMIRGGATSGLDQWNQLQEQGAALREASTRSIQEGIGSGFRAYGALYQTDQDAKGMGYQGVWPDSSGTRQRRLARGSQIVEG